MVILTKCCQMVTSGRKGLNKLRQTNKLFWILRQYIFYNITFSFKKGKKKFCKKGDHLCKKIDPKKFLKSDSRFEFLDHDYPSVNPYKKLFFVKKVILCVKKLIQKYFKKLTPDSSSSTSITLRSTLIKKFFFRSVTNVRTHSRTNRLCSLSVMTLLTVEGKIIFS
jgi:hypothetical protein